MKFRPLLILIGCSLIGCNKDASPTPQATPESQAHFHGSGPHGGVVADWGHGAYHVEFTVDHDKKETTVHILGSDGKSPSPIKADKIVLNVVEPLFQVDCVAKPLEGESEGRSSRFVGQHDNLGIVREFEGAIQGEIDGNSYSGRFKEKPAK